MKYLTFLAAPVLIFTCIACGHGRPVDETGTTETTAPVPVTPVNSTVQPQTMPVNINSQTTPSTTVTPSGTTVAGLNPEHGKPGHRCDIAVGAPLNSAPTQQTTPSVTTPVTTPVNISSDKLSLPAATTPVAAGMNPAHGEPGHRCDISVGAPLNSKPAPLPATNGTTPINISSDKIAQPVATTAVAPGMNPAHGEPGHRCDIAVGAPLNSKPTVVTGTPSTNTVSSSQSIPSVVPIKPVLDPKKDNR
jgi:hypothetical protein